MAIFKLRGYQEILLTSINEAFQTNSAVMAQMCTGAGKTGVAASWAAQFDGPSLFICHTLSVINQVPGEFRKWGVKAHVAKGANFAKLLKLSGQFTIAASPILVRNRIGSGAIQLDQFSAIIVDEAHHAPDGNTAAAKIVLDAKQQGIPILGITATPWRMGRKQGFNKTWDTLVHGPEWVDLEGEYLAAPILKGADVADLIHGSGGGSQDFVAGATTAANIDNPIFSEGAFDYMDKRGARKPDGELRKTLMYAVGQKHALMLAKIALERGIPTGLLASSKEILDQVPGGIETDRQRVNERLQDGSLRLVINVNMVTEGYDCPDVECIVCLRPTKSLSLWKQMCGRGSRLADDKRRVLIIDLTDNHRRLFDPLHKHEWTLEPRGKSKIGDAPMRHCDPDGRNEWIDDELHSSGCYALNPPSAKHCKNCGKVQGRVCTKCGKFRLFKRFNQKPECELCDKAVEAARQLADNEARSYILPKGRRVLFIAVKRTKHNHEYFTIGYRQDGNRRVANAFKNNLTNAEWKVLQRAATKQQLPALYVEVIKKDGWTNISRVYQG